MAYNNGGQGGPNAPQARRISYNMGTFFSSRKNGNEYQMVKVGFYNEALTFNFYKGTSGAANQQSDSFIKFEYEAAVALKGLFEQLIRTRVAAYRAGEPYREHWFNYDLVFTDKETHQPRKAGSFMVKAAQAEDSSKNVVSVSFNNGTEEWCVVLGTTFLPSQLSQVDTLAMDIDVYDSRLYAFAQLVDSMIRHWPILVQNDKAAQLMMGKFQAICDKLGIDSTNQNGGRYSQDSYRSKGGAPSGGAIEGNGGSYNNDEPF